MGDTSFLIVISLLLCGAAGAIAKDILNDGCLELPHIANGSLFLGFFGAVLLGAAIGYFVDHSPITAFFAGYTGFSAIEHLNPYKSENTSKKEPEQ
jgi:hypothetical protein